MMLSTTAAKQSEATRDPIIRVSDSSVDKLNPVQLLILIQLCELRNDSVA